MLLFPIDKASKLNYYFSYLNPGYYPKSAWRISEVTNVGRSSSMSTLFGAFNSVLTGSIIISMGGGNIVYSTASFYSSTSSFFFSKFFFDFFFGIHRPSSLSMTSLLDLANDMFLIPKKSKRFLDIFRLNSLFLL